MKFLVAKLQIYTSLDFIVVIFVKLNTYFKGNDPLQENTNYETVSHLLKNNQLADLISNSTTDSRQQFSNSISSFSLS